MSGKKSNLPDGRIPDRLPDGRPAVAWRSRWTEGVLPLWLVATAGGMAVIFVVGLFFYGSYVGVGSSLIGSTETATRHRKAFNHPAAEPGFLRLGLWNWSPCPGCSRRPCGCRPVWPAGLTRRHCSKAWSGW
jgi:photosystem II PsbJ protein